MIFFPGLDDVYNAKHFARCFISVNRLRDRRSDFSVNDWMLDSGAFSELERHGRFRDFPEVYAAQVKRWALCGNLLAAVSQDFMCEAFMLGKTGLTVAEHQRLTIERYEAIREGVGDVAYVLPVLQGYEPKEYLDHLAQYGGRLTEGQWVGVGSVCNTRPTRRCVRTAS